MTNEAFVTTFAQRGELLACTLEGALCRVFTGYTVKVTRPEESTSGGKRATQHIQLIRNEDGLAFVVGSANTADGTATLRTLGHSLTLSKRRFGRELVLPPLEYMRFLDAVTRVLESFEIEVAVVAFDPADRRSEPPPASVSGTQRRTTLPYVVGVLASVSTFAALGAALAK